MNCLLPLPDVCDAPLAPRGGTVPGSCRHDTAAVAELELQYARSLREKAAALVELSALLFNRPDLHDARHQAPAWQRWRDCDLRLRQLRQRMDEWAMSRQGAVAVRCASDEHQETLS